MNLKNRQTLKEFFSKGKMPAEANFEALIDSMVNRIDDGFSKDMENGMMLSPEGSSRNVLGFFRSIEQKNAAWTISIDAEDKNRGLCFGEPGQQGGVRLFLQENGNIGVGTITPAHPLEVNGVAAMKGRVGTFARGTFPANGEWHPVLANLNGCQAFEIVARVGEPGKGRYALLHATALSTFGRSNSKITKSQAYYGWWWNKMKIRWNGTTFNYGMEIRSRRNYGKDIMIHYHITKLWGDEEMGFKNTNNT